MEFRQPAILVEAASCTLTQIAQAVEREGGAVERRSTTPPRLQAIDRSPLG
jgi:hypothetical protein